jgi:hypothetical protein
MRLGREKLLQGNRDPGLADPGFPDDYRHLALPGRGSTPPVAKQVQLLFSTRKRRHVRAVKRFESACHRSFLDRLPSPNSLRESLQRDET